MERLVSLLGLFVMLAAAFALSNNRRRMPWRLIVTGIVLQFLIGLVILQTEPGRWLFQGMGDAINKFLEFSNAGASFVFGSKLVNEKGQWGLAFFVLPTIIFVSAVMSCLFYLGIMQLVVKGMAKVMVWVMDTSGSESLAAAANVFMGHTEAPLVIRPYLLTMTESELLAMMTAGMATVAGGVMAAYVGFGADGGHLLTASVMSAPAALVISKIMIPETGESVTKGTVKIDIPKEDSNILDAACRGAGDGLKLALNVGAMLIAFVALIYMCNAALDLLPNFNDQPLTFQRILGWALAPVAWLMGCPWEDCEKIGGLLGTKTVLNEFIAYIELGAMKDQISPRSFTIATYALCGFANFGSIAVQIGGVGNLVPERRRDIARLGIKSMIGGTLAAFTTACIAGVLISD
ncbi:MAG: NupC/NupG family nucleoside CNT transporter [Planctomycetaceae bacterium]|nr:putative nucleoside permease NupX [Planctomycetota bacterium]MCQ3949200.1 NupC/NupG family nucleoside CNT transporter [Planctomycetota bacterium]NUO17018.1 NupC/NupG family nucleoside CNT transporter [Planctomycetaceae bacterium]GIK53072.1 MAG: nucleoside permease [Planctomycetota bacterium]HRJ79019.1 NupC/NupG family nucleoside CNT transporter [Planctomycetota bacterium]